VPAPLYSVPFISTGAVTTGSYDYVVPTGKVASIRCVTGYKGTSTLAVQFFAMVFNPGGTIASVFFIADMPSTTILQSVLWNGMVVAPAGWTIRVGRTSGTATWAGTVSGFLLSVP